MRATTAAVGLALVLGLTACSSHPAAPASARSSTPAASPAPAPASPTPAARLTKADAARAYVRIVDPGNALVDDLNRAEADAAPIADGRAILRRAVTELHREAGQLLALRWPKRAQPYITVLATVDLPTEIACAHAEAHAASWDALDTIDATNQDCTTDAASTTPATIRERLGLPSPQ
jgi:hypothetical protein